jgi:putative aldouronate transport system substrate-binding protein
MDYLSSDEGYELSYWGIKGTHYTDPLQGRSAEGQKAFEEKWLDPLSQISNRADLQKKWRDGSTSAPIKANAVYTNAAMSNNLLIDILYGTPTTDEQKTLSPDLTKFEEDMRIRFITGLETFSKWDEYVKNWKEKGGDKILDSRIKAYNQINSKNYTSGIK